MSTAKITIVNLTGPALRESTHDGARFVGGTLGQSYSIAVENLTHGRILAVITVDGRNVLDASPGDHAGNGYVLGGRQTFRCDGWRTSGSTVAEFVFTSAADSYAASTLGDASQVGVIGVAVFTEEPVYRDGPRRPVPLGDVLRGGGARGQSTGAPPAGTGFGSERASHVTGTSFKRHGEPEIHVIRYDTITALVDAGIMMRQVQPTDAGSLRLAEPFPASAPAYCPRPGSGQVTQ